MLFWFGLLLALYLPWASLCWVVERVWSGGLFRLASHGLALVPGAVCLLLGTRSVSAQYAALFVSALAVGFVWWTCLLVVTSSVVVDPLRAAPHQGTRFSLGFGFWIWGGYVLASAFFS